MLVGEKVRQRKMDESVRQCGRGRKESESGWRLWITDVAHWGFGRDCMCLIPALAGWHRGEREVTTPQHKAHKIQTGEGGEERGNRPQTQPRTEGQWVEQIIL